MQGVYNQYGQRMKTKKSLREAITNDEYVLLEATSMFGDEYTGPLGSAPDGDYYIVGPDPYRDRRWYAHITKTSDSIKIK